MNFSDISVTPVFASRSRWGAFCSILAAALCIAPTPAQAVSYSTMYFNGAYSVVATNGTEPLGGIAADANGNLYLVDLTNKAIIEETLQANGTYASSAIIASLSDPRAVALDAAGNLYVADAGLHQV